MNFSGLVNAFQIVNQSLKNSLGNFANFKLFVPERATIALDELTGEYVNIPAETIIYTARVRENKNIKETNIIGDRTTRINLTGYLVEPLNFTDVLGQKVEAEILKNGIWIKGFFYSTLDLESEAIEVLEIRKALGDNINGYFEIQGNPLN
jgi:hypothetical protein